MPGGLLLEDGDMLPCPMRRCMHWSAPDPKQRHLEHIGGVINSGDVESFQSQADRHVPRAAGEISDGTGAQ